MDRKKYQGMILGIVFTVALMVGMPAAMMRIPYVAAQEDSKSPGTEADLEDGVYRISVTMSGGSGKATIESPTELTVQSGKASARIAFSSPNYDYMIVDGVTFLPDNTTGNSVFHIPVTVFDSGMEVIADTTAMSTPHEITYTLYFDSSSVSDGKTAGDIEGESDRSGEIWNAGGKLIVAVVGIIVCIVALGIVIFAVRGEKSHRKDKK